MQRPSVAVLSRFRTIFIENGESRYEDHSALMELRAGRYMITHNYALQHLEPYYVSFPVMNLDRKFLHGWYSSAIGAAEHYREEVIAERLSIDWDYLLEPR